MRRTPRVDVHRSSKRETIARSAAPAARINVADAHQETLARLDETVAELPCQQPEGKTGETPGVGAAPDALAGSTVAGNPRFIVIPSVQADVLGLGATAPGSMPVPTSPLMTAGIVPGGGPAGTCGIESGKLVALTTDPPGVELHAVVVPVPDGAIGAIVPIELPVCPWTGAIGVTLPGADSPGLDTIGVAGTGIGAVEGGAQTTTVPGVVGSIASGTDASVVSGAPVRVVAENGPGLLSGEVTIAPGTVGRLIAVLPVVATWAWQDEHPSSRVANAAHAMRIMTASPGRRRPCGSPPDCLRPD